MPSFENLACLPKLRYANPSGWRAFATRAKAGPSQIFRIDEALMDCS